jgi:CheY-like chemotaxis protein
MPQKVLIVDDDKGYLLAVRRMLESEDYEVVTAASATEGRDRLKEKPLPDLILLDVLMPTEDGFSFADALSKDKTFSDIPVVLVTAVAESPGQMRQAFEKDKGLTAADILRKSHVHQQLIPTVRKVLKEG